MLTKSHIPTMNHIVEPVLAFCVGVVYYLLGVAPKVPPSVQIHDALILFGKLLIAGAISTLGGVLMKSVIKIIRVWLRSLKSKNKSNGRRKI